MHGGKEEELGLCFVEAWSVLAWNVGIELEVERGLKLNNSGDVSKCLALSKYFED